MVGAEPTRASIWQALRERRCYATTGARILLDVSVGDAAMGGTARVQTAVPVRCRVTGTAPIERVELRRGMQIAGVFRPGTLGGQPQGLRLSWSGIHPRRRYARMTWRASLQATGIDLAQIEAAGGGVAISAASDGSLVIQSHTQGEERALWLPLIAGEQASVSFAAEHAALEWRAGWPEARTLTRTGSVWAEVIAAPWAALPAVSEAAAEWLDTPTPGRHAYWLKVVQADGQMALSSPVYVEIG